MRPALGLVAVLACAGQPVRMYDWLEGPPPAPGDQPLPPEQPRPIAVALAASTPGVTLTPAGEVNGQRFISAGDAWKLLAVDVSRPPAAPPVTPVLRRSGMYLWAVYRLCVNERGALSMVTQLKSADLLVDDDWRRTIRLWRFRPLMDGGGKKPFCSDVPIGVRVL